MPSEDSQMQDKPCKYVHYGLSTKNQTSEVLGPAEVVFELAFRIPAFLDDDRKLALLGHDPLQDGDKGVLEQWYMRSCVYV